MAFVAAAPLRPLTLPSIAPRHTRHTRPTILPLQTIPRPTLRMTFRRDAANALKVALACGLVTVSSFALLTSDASASILNISGARPPDLGVLYGRYLNACPPTNNCISSSANAFDSHYVPPWTYNSDEAKKPKKSMEEAIADLTKVISETPRTTIIETKPIQSDFGNGFYLYAEFQSKLLGFVDDAEFYFKPDSSTVEYRSASRLGESDFGVNRSRIRDLRVALQNLDNRWASTGY